MKAIIGYVCVFCLFGLCTPSLAHYGAESKTNDKFISKENLRKIRKAEAIFCTPQSFLDNKSFLDLALEVKPENFKQFITDFRMKLMEKISATKEQIRQAEKKSSKLKAKKDSLDINLLASNLGAQVATTQDSLIFFPDAPSKEKKKEIANLLGLVGTSNKKLTSTYRQASHWVLPRTHFEYELSPQKITSVRDEFNKVSKEFNEASLAQIALVNQLHRMNTLLDEVGKNASLDQQGYLNLSNMTLFLNAESKEAFLHEGINPQTQENTGIQLCQKESSPTPAIPDLITYSKEECEELMNSNLKLSGTLEVLAEERMQKTPALNFSAEQLKQRVVDSENLRLKRNEARKAKGQILKPAVEEFRLSEYQKNLSKVDRFKENPTLGNLEIALLGNDTATFGYKVRVTSAGVEFYPVIQNVKTEYPFADDFGKSSSPVGEAIALSSQPLIIIDPKLFEPTALLAMSGSDYVENGSNLGRILILALIKDCYDMP